ncbi:ParA family protein [Vibrio metschnikovii]|nr:ParA family protein [Vibrio metschnikovii]
MELKAKLIQLGTAMRDKSLSLRKEIIEESAVKFNEDKLENGVTRLIHNHAVNKTTLGQDILGLSKNTSSKRITQLINEGVISEPYLFNRQHMFTLHQVHDLINHLGFKKYRDTYDPVVVCVGNYKGGVGKTTTTTSLATKTALDINLNAKVLIIDLDPQGSARGMMTVSEDSEEVFITISDLLRAPFEESYLDSENEAKAFLDEGYDFKEVVLAAPFSTHIPNLNVITAFPTDENFTKLYWSLCEEQRKELLMTFSKKVVPILKEEYDIIYLDLPPQNSPITWSALEASDMLLTPITPRTYDYVSTYSYFLTLPDYLKSTPSQGNNIRWFKMLPVNYNENNKQERKTYHRLLETVGSDMIIKPIKHSPFFHEAAEKHRTIYDIIRTESMCTDIQYYDAINSVNEVYNTFISELRTFSSKQNGNFERE